jgi:hypothetical protein
MSSNDFTPQVKSEKAIFAVFQESEKREEALKRRLIEIQASNVLNELYCCKLRAQLAHQDKKKDTKGKETSMGDGLPCFLSGDWFYAKVVGFEAWQMRGKSQLESRCPRKWLSP